MYICIFPVKLLALVVPMAIHHTDAGSVKLINIDYSMYGVRVRYALHLKGIQYEHKEEDHSAEHKSEELLQANPVYKLYPVLIHNGKSIPESRIIVDYIDSAWPHAPKLLPDDPYEKAKAQFWGEFVDRKIFAPGDKILTTPSWNLQERSKAVEEIKASYRTLDEALSKVTSDSKPFFGGKEMNYADVCVAPIFYCLKAYETVGCFKFPSVEECPSLHKYAAAIGQLDFIRALTPDPDDTAEFCLELNKKISETR